MTQQSYKFSQAELDSLVSDYASRLKSQQGFSDFPAYAAKRIFVELQKDPKRYLEFGVYWFALKKALLEYGYNFGDYTDSVMADEYSGKTASHTFVAAYKFSEFYLQNYFVGNREFELDNDVTWTLYDSDMETLALIA